MIRRVVVVVDGRFSLSLVTCRRAPLTRRGKLRLAEARMSRKALDSLGEVGGFQEGGLFRRLTPLLYNNILADLILPRRIHIFVLSGLLFELS